METKTKWDLGAPLIVGIVFSFMGASFLAIGIALYFFASDSDATVGLVFMPLGALFLILGIGLFSAMLSKKRRNDRLLAGGRYIWGEIVEFTPNFSVQINGRHPRVAIVRYEDAVGVHIFRSRNLYRYPEASAVGRQVKVYYQDAAFKHYYVDIDSALPKVFEH